MKEIPLTQGKVALVDDEDFEWLSQWKWYAIRSKDLTFYAVRGVKRNGKVKRFFMHKEILKNHNLLSDHKDGNGLNNQKTNLRPCDYQHNAMNRRLNQLNKTSHFKGVSLNRQHNKWLSQITLSRKHIFLGRFNSEIEAALEYDKAAHREFGEFAVLNFN